MRPGPYRQKLKFPFFKDAFRHVWLKLAILISKAHVNLGSDVLKRIILLNSRLSMAVSRGSFQK